MDGGVGTSKGQAELFWGKVSVVCAPEGERDMRNANSQNTTTLGPPRSPSLLLPQKPSPFTHLASKALTHL